MCHLVRGKIPYCRRVDMHFRVVYIIFRTICGITELISFWGSCSSRICRRLKSEDIILPWNVRIRLPIDVATDSRETESSAVPLWKLNKTGTVRIMQHGGACAQPLLTCKSNKCYIFCVCVCSLGYLAWKGIVSYYIVICGLSGCTIFFHIMS